MRNFVRNYERKQFSFLSEITKSQFSHFLRGHSRTASLYLTMAKAAHKCCIMCHVRVRCSIFHSGKTKASREPKAINKTRELTLFLFVLFVFALQFHPLFSDHSDFGNHIEGGPVEGLLVFMLLDFSTRGDAL